MSAIVTDNRHGTRVAQATSLRLPAFLTSGLLLPIMLCNYGRFRT